MVLKGNMNKHMERQHPGEVSTECKSCKKKFWWESAAIVHECSKEPSMRHVVVKQMISQMEILKRIEGDISRWKTLDETDKM